VLRGQFILSDRQGNEIEVWNSNNPHPTKKIRDLHGRAVILIAIDIFYRGKDVGEKASLRSSNGWPFAFLNRYNPDTNSPTSYKFSPFFFAITILIAFAILAATIFTSESYLRRQPRWQFSIQSIMVFTVYVAILTMNYKYGAVRWRGDATWEYIPFFFICLGLWCVFWTAWRLVAMGVSRIGGGAEDG